MRAARPLATTTESAYNHYLRDYTFLGRRFALQVDQTASINNAITNSLLTIYLIIP
jgi:hypothetical protein